MSLTKLFRSTETDFTHNEWVLNEIISCKATEGINDDYTTELEYPLEDSKNISSNLVVGGIVSLPTIDDRPNQLFRIIDKDTSLTTITVQTQAKLLADLKENRVRAMTLTGLTRKQAIQTVLNNCLDPHPYTVGNRDINTNTNVIVNIEEGNPLSAIIGDKNSILSEYGGEFIVDNNTIDIVDSRGSDNGVVIEYGKNLSSIKEHINNVDLATVLVPRSGDYRLPEYYVESSRVNQYEKRYFKDVEMNLNIWDGEGEKKDDQITIEEAYKLMRNTCNKMFIADKVDQMKFNYTINFIELSKTEEYKNYAILETVNIGDKITVRHKKLNLDLDGRVNDLSYTIDSEGNKTIDTVSIGFNRKEITDIIKIAMKSIKFTKDEILLNVNNSVNNLNTQIDIQDGKISAVVESEDGGATWKLSKTAFNVAVEATGLKSALDLQAEKIAAVVQGDGTGFGWTLNQVAFIVACLGASGASVEINADGLTVKDGKFYLMKGSSTVFEVDLDGVCNAIGGFIVKDGDASCTIDSTGMKLVSSNGKEAKIEIIDDAENTGVYIPDDLIVNDWFEVGRAANFKGEVFIGEITIQDYIINVIQDTVKSESLI